jgi:uncharacterized small protein (DUF1192 family)
MEPDLSTLSLKELKCRARALGAPAETIEDLDDAADSKAAAIDMIVQLTPTTAPEPESSPVGEQEDLAALSVKELKRRARALGATDEAIEDLDDADDIKVATKIDIVPKKSLIVQLYTHRILRAGLAARRITRSSTVGGGNTHTHIVVSICKLVSLLLSGQVYASWGSR